MSELNDELLNYELGDDFDEQELLGDEEEEALLESDEEQEYSGLNYNSNESDSDVSGKKKQNKNLPLYSEKIANSNIETNSTLNEEEDVSTTENHSIESPNKSDRTISGLLFIDEVSSTNKESDEQLGHFRKGIKKVHDNADISEGRGKRKNIKQSVERKLNEKRFIVREHHSRFPSKRGRGHGPMRGNYFTGTRPYIKYTKRSYCTNLRNENVAPMQGPYSTYNPISPHLNSSYFPVTQTSHSNDYIPVIRPNFPSQSTDDFNSFPNISPAYTRNTTNSIPYTPFRPNPVHPSFHLSATVPGIQQRFDSIYGSGSLVQNANVPLPQIANINSIPTTSFDATHSMHSNTIPTSSVDSNSSKVLKTKILINPNFKGGVEAATNQLMKDTQFIQTVNKHLLHLQSDDELLRQQEEFINRNRMHIKKRQYDRSPAKYRSRDRSYTPDRNHQGSIGSHRIQSDKIFDKKNYPKRRTSKSVEKCMEAKQNAEEDEETRVYRLEIEKQKAMREKILKNKEMRRRQAIEEKIHEGKTGLDELPQKLKPLIVTKSKIISLKKKSNSASDSLLPLAEKYKNETTDEKQSKLCKINLRDVKNSTDVQMSLGNMKPVDNSRKSPTEATDITKSNLKTFKTYSSSESINEDEFLIEEDLLNEEELLADEPFSLNSSKYKPIADENLNMSSNNSRKPAIVNRQQTNNRRIVLKSSKDQYSNKIKKGVFERLEKKSFTNDFIK